MIGLEKFICLTQSFGKSVLVLFQIPLHFLQLSFSLSQSDESVITLSVIISHSLALISEVITQHWRTSIVTVLRFLWEMFAFDAGALCCLLYLLLVLRAWEIRRSDVTVLLRHLAAFSPIRQSEAGVIHLSAIGEVPLQLYLLPCSDLMMAIIGPLVTWSWIVLLLVCWFQIFLTKFVTGLGRFLISESEDFVQFR